jgi:hypothetical protein
LNRHLRSQFRCAVSEDARVQELAVTEDGAAFFSAIRAAGLDDRRLAALELRGLAIDLTYRIFLS